jgi:hypothetical protein
MRVRPALDEHGEPLQVHYEGSRRVLDGSGEDVPDNAFWRRRIAQGDVILEEPEGAPQ